MPETFVGLGEPPEMHIRCCVLCGEPADLYDVDCGPWCSGRSGVVRVPVKPCCGALDGDECDCAELAVQMQSAPLVVIGGGAP